MAAPLVESIRFGQLQITKLLLENGADPYIKEVLEGETALLVAKKNDRQDAIALLNNYFDKSI
jgi:ankyrin repeat protein